MHPAKVQLRDFSYEELSKAIEIAKKAYIIKTNYGIDLFFDDVDDARFFISKLKKKFRITIKMSTENLGFESRAKFLFVYSIRKI
ncbi:MAG: hypothetical protein RMH75_04105 [Archaeoglobaceae archaeon]|nr:hypothetical protein [Archaeoglobaceae archaeon]